MVRFHLLSDLHLEDPVSYDLFEYKPPTPATEYLALLGDIGCLKHTDEYMQFLLRHLAHYKVVFLVLGNHEPWGLSWPAAKAITRTFEENVKKRRAAGEKLGEFVVLDQTRYDIDDGQDGVTVLGCTLFTHVPEDKMAEVEIGLQDFYQIKASGGEVDPKDCCRGCRECEDEQKRLASRVSRTPKTRRRTTKITTEGQHCNHCKQFWTVEEHNAAHESDKAWLTARLHELEGSGRKVVVFTHHSPTVDSRSIDPRHSLPRKGPPMDISSGFATDLSREPLWASKEVRVWAFGHTHFNCDFVDDVTGKRAVTNQRGNHGRSDGFDQNLVIEV